MFWFITAMVCSISQFRNRNLRHAQLLSVDVQDFVSNAILIFEKMYPYVGINQVSLHS